MKQTNNYSEQFLRRRKMMLVVPVVIVPALCVAFYGLGGGKGDAGHPTAGEMKGLNMTLPLARIDARNQPQDKLGFYEKAKQDSMRLSERKKQDPYAVKSGGSAGGMDSGSHPAALKGIGGLSPLDAPSAERQADEALAKLDQLKQLLGKKAPGFMNDSGLASTGLSARIGDKSEGRPAAEARVAAFLEQLKGGSASPGDPQMDRLDGMLDKLIRIQHPDLVNTDTAKSLGVAAALVSLSRPENAVSSLAAADGETGVGFIEIGTSDGVNVGRDTVRDTARDAAIEAVINTDQTLTSGSTVALRIVHAVTVNGQAVPANQLVYGEASLSGERLMIGIRSLRVGESIVPVSMQVYDLDGLAGIRVPGAITRDVSKESADQALSGLEVASVDPSLSAQAASAGLAFARSLASRKIRLVRVSLPAGYRVLLKNSKSFTR
jgi:hypothetical protein